MDIELLKIQAGGYLRTARGMLVRDGVYFPMLYAVSEESTLPIGLNAENEGDKREITEIMAAMKNKCDAMILIMDMYLIEFDKKPKEDPVNIKDDPRSTPALVCFLYTKNESFMRQFQYIKRENFNFFDFDWEKFDEMSGKFESPFKKN